MIEKQVHIARIQTLADGSIRLVIDLLNSQANDMSIAYNLREVDTTMILVPTKDYYDNKEADIN